MKTFDLKILASNRDFFEGKCQYLTVPAYDGEMGIMANHDNMAFALKDGNIRITYEDGTKQTAVVTSGFVEIIDNKVFLLAHTVELPEEIDIKRAKEAMEQAKEILSHKQSKEQYSRSMATLSRAMARINGAKK